MMLLVTGLTFFSFYGSYSKEDGSWDKVETVKEDKSCKSRDCVTFLDQETYMEDYANFRYIHTIL